ncbi:thrombospondin type-1 domain-containing protein 4-like [Octopus sinensis]|uniref:Thrombospondin type-1 domain-containing protein 4-like n=1 Tax=Octopus sinensis TaxID=2607531 RepID=A0A7E6EIU1_9MOLL|nr:thrombospondin type-1 domain-containing protein 4-like [Octopus sinensis]
MQFEPFELRWLTSKWSKCSTSCGLGRRYRDVVCGVYVPFQFKFIHIPSSCCMKANSSQCHSYILRTKTNLIHPLWYLTKNGTCSSQCGQGFRQLDYECRQEFARDQWISISTKFCSYPPPIMNQTCYGSVCFAKWDYSPWNQTYVQLNANLDRVFLQYEDAAYVFNISYLEIKCPLKNSNLTRNYVIADSNILTFVVTEWSQCSLLCGIGSQERSVQCALVSQNSYTIVSSSLCDSAGLVRPAVERNCGSLCPRWKTSEWSEVAKICVNQ